MRRLELVILFIVMTAGLPAKIADPKALIVGDDRYLSHANTLTRESVRTGNVVWSRQLNFRVNPQHYKPGVEQDVQWTIISSVKLVGETLVVKNSRGQVFHLNRYTGRPI